MLRQSLSVACAALWLCACSKATPEAPRVPTVTLTASPNNLASGQNLTLRWSSSDSNTCSASGSWAGAMPTSGTETFPVYDAGSYIFVLSCFGPGGSAVAAAEVRVDGGTYNQISVSLSANPTVVAVGQSTTVTWSAPEAQSCTANGNWSGTKSAAGSASVVVANAGYSYFGLSCTGPQGSGYQEVYVQGLQAAVILSAAPVTAGAGQKTTLTWSTSSASACTASGDWSGAKPASGSEEVTLPASLGDHRYTLSCSDPGAAATQNVTVTAVAPSLSLGAFPKKTLVGETVTLTWDGAYAQGCTASQGWAGTHPAKGTKTLAVMSVPGTVEYVLTCSNAGGTATKSILVNAVAASALPPATAYHMNPRHDGFVTFSGGITLPATAAPAWSRDLGAQVGYSLIADGRVYVVTENTDGSYGNRLFALDQATGATIWGPVGLPGVYSWNGTTYADGRIFALNFDGLVRAFSAATGAGLWSYQMPGYWHDAEPVAYGGLVFATGNYGSAALDQATGSLQWSRQIYGDRASPAVTSEGLYLIPGGGCGPIALNPLTGEDLWTASTCNNYGADLAVSRGIVYARYTDGNGFMADAATGASAGILSSQRAVAVTDSAFITLYSGTLTATSIATGVQKWNFTGDGSLVSAPIVVNDTVFIGSSSGKVFAVDAATGAQQWFGTTSAMSAPDQWNISLLSGLVAGEGLLVVSGNNTVAAWRLK